MLTRICFLFLSLCIVDVLLSFLFETVQSLFKYFVSFSFFKPKQRNIQESKKIMPNFLQDVDLKPPPFSFSNYFGLENAIKTMFQTGNISNLTLINKFKSSKRNF